MTTPTVEHPLRAKPWKRVVLLVALAVGAVLVWRASRARLDEVRLAYDLAALARPETATLRASFVHGGTVVRETMFRLRAGQTRVAQALKLPPGDTEVRLEVGYPDGTRALRERPLRVPWEGELVLHLR